MSDAGSGGDTAGPAPGTDGAGGTQSSAGDGGSTGRVAGAFPGGRTGLVLWLGLCLALGLPWQVGFWLPDTYTVANTLVALEEGHLAITRVRYTLALGQLPGLHAWDGRLYGRNYGQAALALPLLVALRAVSAVASLPVALAGAWSLGAVAFTHHLGKLVGAGRRWVTGRRVRLAGGGAALAAFAASLALAEPVDATLLPLVALQAGSLLAAATAGLLAFLLVARFHGRGGGIAAGLALGLATPVALWATVPKRHVTVVALAFAGLYAFALSRTCEGRRGEAALAGAYVATGLATWIHVFEGGLLVAGLVAVDLVTGGVSRRRVALAGVGLLAGLAPTLVTNWLVSGNPLLAPRLLPPAGTTGPELAPEAVGGSGPAGANGTGGAANGTGQGAPGSGGDGGGGLVAAVATLLAFALDAVGQGLAALVNPGRLWHVFVRSGRIPGVEYAVNDYEVIELTVLESAPLLGGLLALPAIAGKRLRAGVDAPVAPWRALSPARQTDLLAAAWGVGMAVITLPYLPLFSQVTVRYLLPATALGVYGVARIGAVREAIRIRGREAGPVAAVSAVGGAAALAAILARLEPATGEALQFHALVNLGAALAFAAAVTGRVLAPTRVPPRTVAWTGAVTAGLTGAFLLLLGVEYVQYGPVAVGVARAIEGAVGVF